jgi:hypothetical protein
MQKSLKEGGKITEYEEDSRKRGEENEGWEGSRSCRDPDRFSQPPHASELIYKPNHRISETKATDRPNNQISEIGKAGLCMDYFLSTIISILSSPSDGAHLHYVLCSFRLRGLTASILRAPPYVVDTGRPRISLRLFLI